VGCKSDVKRFVKLDTMKAQAYTDGNGDCDKIAKNYSEWKSKYGKEYKSLQTKLNGKYHGKAEIEKAFGSNADQMKANKKIVIGSIFKCMNNDAYKKAVESH
jgi:hypothetical protein